MCTFNKKLMKYLCSDHLASESEEIKNHFWPRQELKVSQCLSVHLKQVCLEQTIFLSLVKRASREQLMHFNQSQTFGALNTECCFLMALLSERRSEEARVNVMEP